MLHWLEQFGAYTKRRTERSIQRSFTSRMPPPPRRQQKYLYTCMPATTVRQQLVLSRSAWQKLLESHDASLEIYRVREQETNHKSATTTPARVRAVHPSNPEHAGRPWAVGPARKWKQIPASHEHVKPLIRETPAAGRHRAHHSRHLSLTLLSQSTVLLPLPLPLSLCPPLARFGAAKKRPTHQGSGRGELQQVVPPLHPSQRISSMYTRGGLKRLLVDTTPRASLRHLLPSTDGTPRTTDGVSRLGLSNGTPTTSFHAYASHPALMPFPLS